MRMTVWTGVALLLAGLVLGGRWLSGVQAEGEPSGAASCWGKAVKGLACSIRTGQESYKVGENIPLEFLLRSEYEAPITAMDPRIQFTYYGDALPLTITGPDGAHRYNGSLLEPPPPPSLDSFIQLNAGEIRGVWATHHKPLQIIPKYWDITKPGSYTISLTYQPYNDYQDADGKMKTNATAWSGTLVSNMIRVKVE